MIEVGHFKELHSILNFVYTKRNEKKLQLEKRNALKQKGIEVEDIALKNRKNELSGVDNIGKLKVIEGRQDLDLSKAVDLTVNDDIMAAIEEDKEVLIESEDEAEDSEEEEELDRKQKREKRQKKLKAQD